ncbi:hypothetical protein [Veillonella denticariosi]|mgnify:FL=1|uniref:hypothetical protein n=1 Tax=Veillonella denticariosi TaxID=419208 RepID=UPI002490D09C|nr:hypothetical protein [Veillonella denticariosi]
MPVGIYNVSISHSGQYTLVCQTTRELTVGVDLQELTIGYQLEWFNSERPWINGYLSEDYLLQLMTSFKESLGKYLGIGLMARKEIFEIDLIEMSGEKMYKAQFFNFPTLKGIGYLKENYIVTLVTNESDLPLFVEKMEKTLDEI